MKYFFWHSWEVQQIKYILSTWNKEAIYRHQVDHLSKQRKPGTGMSSFPRGQAHSSHHENAWNKKGSESQGDWRYGSVAVFLENPGPIPSTHMRAHNHASPQVLGDPMPFPAHHAHCRCPDTPTDKTSIKTGYRWVKKKFDIQPIFGVVVNI